MRRVHLICFFAVATIVASSLALAAPAQRYVLTDLGSIPDARQSAAVAINNRGEVIVNTNGGKSALVWVPDRPNGTTGRFWNMGAIDPGETQWREYGTETIAYGINDKGEIVGVSGSAFHYKGFGSSLPFKTAVGSKLDKSCVMRDGSGNVPYAINNRGVVVGALEDASSSHAVKWDPDGRYVSLGKLGKDALVSFTSAGATDINDNGTIVGYSEQNAWVLRGMHKRDLGKGWANAVNNHDVIAGTSHGRACIWIRGKRRLLDTKHYRGDMYYDEARGGYSTADGINDVGQVVGSYEASAALWYRGKVTDLENCTRLPAGWTLVSARAISNKGQIVGSATVGDSPDYHAFLLTPIRLNL